MKYLLNYKEIFFDRYNLDDEEKKKHAMYIVDKALSEKNIGYNVHDDVIEVEYMEIEKELEFDKIVDILKREFFLFIQEYETPEEEKRTTTMEEYEGYIRKMCLNEGFTITDVCEHFKIKRSTFDNMFVKTHGETGKDYLKRIRVEKARELIENGEKMETVAYLCGFGSVKTMQRAFKSVYGKTPGECRLSFLDTRINE